MKQSSDNRQVKTSNRQIFCPQLRGMNRSIIVRCPNDYSTPDSPDNPNPCGAVPFCRSSNRQIIVRSIPAIVRLANGLPLPVYKSDEDLGETLIFGSSYFTLAIFSQKRHQVGTKLAANRNQAEIFRNCLKAAPKGLKTDIEKLFPEGRNNNRQITFNSKWQNSSLLLKELIAVLKITGTYKGDGK